MFAEAEAVFCPSLVHLKQPIGIIPSPELTLGVDLQSEILLAGLYLQRTYFPFLLSNPWVAI